MALTRAQIESKALHVLDLVQQGRKVEDQAVELKAEWIEPTKAARRIAGQANAAGGQPFMWIVGLDEARGLREIATDDMAEWWQKVTACFDGLPPALTDVIVPVVGGAMYVLHFESPAAPYVVKNSSGTGRVTRDVPWREGTRVDSARRDQLLRILVPHAHAPEIEILHAHFGSTEWARRLREPGPSDLEKGIGWSLRVEMYVVPASSEPVVLPVHLTRVAVLLRDGTLLEPDAPQFCMPQPQLDTREELQESISVHVTQAEAVLKLAGRLDLDGRGDAPPDTVIDPVEMRIALQPARTSGTIEIALPLEFQQEGLPFFTSWEYRPPQLPI